MGDKYTAVDDALEGLCYCQEAMWGILVGAARDATPGMPSPRDDAALIAWIVEDTVETHWLTSQSTIYESLLETYNVAESAYNTVAEYAHALRMARLAATSKWLVSLPGFGQNAVNGKRATVADYLLSPAAISAVPPSLLRDLDACAAHTAPGMDPTWVLHPWPVEIDIPRGSSEDDDEEDGNDDEEEDDDDDDDVGG